MSSARASTYSGELIARALAGSWRISPPSLDVSAGDLESVAPLLLGSGAAALVWAKLRRSDLKDSPVAAEFQQAYRLHSVQAAIHDLEIQAVMKLLDSPQTEPVLVKGWAVARFYPEKGLRPYGDIDLCLRPEQFQRAAAVMNTAEGEKYNVDLHVGFEKLHDQALAALFARSEILKLGDANVRVLKLEDQLRMLCAHMLRHGAWRPLWLCDIAAIVESLPAGFDWDLCLSADRRQSEWVTGSIGLAHRLLGARIDNASIAERAARAPNWLVRAVLKQWRWARAIDHIPLELMSVSLRHPMRLPRALYQRWPNPVQATFNLKAPFNNFPRLPLQVADYILQAFSFLNRPTKSQP